MSFLKKMKLLFISLLLLIFHLQLFHSEFIDIASQPYHSKNVQSKIFSIHEQQEQEEIHGPSTTHFQSTFAKLFSTKEELLYSLHDTANKQDINPQQSSPSVWEHFKIERRIDDTLLNGNFYRLRNPLHHFSILEPKNGCNNGTVTVLDTSRGRCQVATNAGFFATRTGNCLGNVISNSNVVQTPNRHNVQFGITKSGKFIVGYLSLQPNTNQVVLKSSTGQTTTEELDQLVAGVVWIVKDGRSFVDQSALLEDMTTQETGSGFVSVRAGRTAIGYDNSGNLMLLVIDGNSRQGKGPNLHEMAQFMMELGAVQAINLDGGGSSTVVQKDVHLNYVSDLCENVPSNLAANCERKVTTVTCIHDFVYEDKKNDPIINTDPISISRIVVLIVLVLFGVFVLGLVAVIISLVWCVMKQNQTIEKQRQLSNIMGDFSDEDSLIVNSKKSENRYKNTRAVELEQQNNQLELEGEEEEVLSDLEDTDATPVAHFR